MKFIPIFLILVASLSLDAISQDPKGSSWKEALANKKGTLACLWNESYGIIYKDEDGVVKGVCSDILMDFKQFVKDKYGISLALNYREEKVFDNFLKDVAATPDLLGVSSVTITDDRRKMFQFSPPYLANPNVLISNRNAKPLIKLEDFSNSHKKFRIKVIKGSSHELYARSLKEKYNPDLMIEFATSSREIFDEMVTDKTLFTIIDCGEFLGAKMTNKEIMLHKVDLGFVDKMGFIMHKKSDWAKVFQEFLTEEYRLSMGYRKIISSNLGSTYLTLIK